MFIADTHLLGAKKGHWFDKLRREWQMHRTFQTMMTLRKPDLVFILGDIFDEGLWSSSGEFENYIKRFHSLFSVPENTYLYVVAGNHDMGFHYAITPYLNQRFINSMKTPSVRRISLRGNHFVLINSMALEGDGCFLCRPTEIALNKIAKHLKCAKNMLSQDCDKANTITRYSRPIILQHYPMYRKSDEICTEQDEAPEDIKNVEFRERWECLSKEASEQLLDILNPRLIVDGHTHHGCRRMHRNDIWEFTVPSFSWRNKNNPSLLLGVFAPDNFAVSKCYMPQESTVYSIYIIGIICILIHFIVRCTRHRYCLSIRHPYSKTL
ncbi:metallophosphoesterase 1 isoform X2 [Prorops nasuta]